MGAPLMLDAVSVSFDGAESDTLHGVSLSLSPGDICVVLGSSGGGKTTLLRAIAGLEPLAGGRVLLDGVDISEVPPHRRRIGFMFQDHALFPHLDVAGNIDFGRARPSIARARRRQGAAGGAVGRGGRPSRRCARRRPAR